MPMAPIGYDPPIYGETGSFLLARALGLIGVSDPRNLAWLFDDMLEASASTTSPMGWVATGSGSFSNALIGITDESGGVSQQDTGATAGSNNAHVGASPLILAVATNPWYVAFRTKVTTAVSAAQTKLFTSIRNAAATKTIGAGVFSQSIAGAASTKYVFQYDGSEAGSAIDTGVVFDTAYHVFEMWGLGTADGGKLHAAMDFGPDLGGVTMASAPTDSMHAYRNANNGTDNVSRAFRTDWFACLSKRS